MLRKPKKKKSKKAVECDGEDGSTSPLIDANNTNTDNTNPIDTKKEDDTHGK